MPGADDEMLLQNAVAMTATAHLDCDTVIVEVDITNDQTGHHVPTDSPLRHLILLVRAIDSERTLLSLVDGPILPEWCGLQAGLPGKTYAKVLQELWTEVSPTAAYWNPTRVLSDNRLAALATDSSTYTFAAPESGEVQVEVSLLYRRAFAGLMAQKGWDVPDILMERTSAALTSSPVSRR
jgi:hypothetical protein